MKTIKNVRRDSRRIKLLLSVVLQIIIMMVPIVAEGQATSSVVEVITTYSQNGQYYLTSIPFDSEFPSLRGKTYVYRVGSSEPLYVFDRGFDSVDVDSNNLILSNDGKVIFYVIPWNRMNGVVMQALAKRRARERTLFLTP